MLECKKKKDVTTAMAMMTDQIWVNKQTKKKHFKGRAQKIAYSFNPSYQFATFQYNQEIRPDTREQTLC